MIQDGKKAAKLHISENNKKSLERILEAITDEMPYSSSENVVLLEHNGVVGSFVEYEKSLILLKNLEIIENFKNTRYGKPVDNGTVYVNDAFEIMFDEKKLLEFSKSLFGGAAAKSSTVHHDKPRIERGSYDIANGILNISGNQVQITKQPNKKGKQNESKQARLMRLLFDDVKGDFGSTPMRTVLSVRAADFRPKHRKLVKSYASEINGKLEQEASVKNFLLCNQQAVMINELYLK